MVGIMSALEAYLLAVRRMQTVPVSIPPVTHILPVAPVSSATLPVPSSTSGALIASAPGSATAATAVVLSPEARLKALNTEACRIVLTSLLTIPQLFGWLLVDRFIAQTAPAEPSTNVAAAAAGQSKLLDAEELS